MCIESERCTGEVCADRVDREMLGAGRVQRDLIIEDQRRVDGLVRRALRVEFEIGLRARSGKRQGYQGSQALKKRMQNSS